MITKLFLCHITQSMINSSPNLQPFPATITPHNKDTHLTLAFQRMKERMKGFQRKEMICNISINIVESAATNYCFKFLYV